MAADLAPLALSVNHVDRRYSDHLVLAGEIERPHEVLMKSRRTERNFRPIREMYDSAKHLVLEFDELVEESLDEMDLSEVRGMDVEEALQDARRGHRQTEELLTKVKREFLETQRITPDIYFLAKKHYTLSKVLLDEIEEHRDDIDFDQVAAQVEDGDVDLGLFKMGMFVALEPMLVNALVLAGQRKDEEFIDAYDTLLDEFGFRFARMFRSAVTAELDLGRLPVSDEEAAGIASSEGF